MGKGGAGVVFGKVRMGAAHVCDKILLGIQAAGKLVEHGKGRGQPLWMAISSVISLSNVDLPDPLAPLIAQRWGPSIANDRGPNSLRSPKRCSSSMTRSTVREAGSWHWGMSMVSGVMISICSFADCRVDSTAFI